MFESFEHLIFEFVSYFDIILPDTSCGFRIYHKRYVHNNNPL